jgi:hypothetical protein
LCTVINIKRPGNILAEAYLTFIKNENANLKKKHFQNRIGFTREYVLTSNLKLFIKIEY